MKRGILWFRNDLRLRDNPALIAALDNCDEILPVYIFDDRYFEKDEWGFIRTGPFRLKFLLESVKDLADHVEEKKGKLILKKGIPEEILPELAQKHDCTAIFAAREYTDEEIKVENKINKALDLNLYHSTTLIHPEDVTFTIEKTPDVFTAFRKKVEKYAQVREPFEIPDVIRFAAVEEASIKVDFETFGQQAPKPDSRAAIQFEGGAMAGFKRLDHYFWDTDAVATYKETRNGLIGEDYSTKFSPWLANGSLSPRSIYYELENYEGEVTKNQSTYWVKFELLWRDYFKYVGMKYGKKIFQEGGIQDKKINWRNNPKLFRQWAIGETGDRFVDANMRELLLTGFMSNRGRQNVASYLVHKLRQDWRKGAAWFESLLVDYDVTSNWGNWMYAGGVGNDPRDRIFNTQKQAGMYDKEGAYRDLWLSDSPHYASEFAEKYFEV